ncbi:uncharacterized protein ColSpa_08440 [Colletotrichum spaethianum]|uniref:Uncharacterized protein n=1 Tax=Colletotrichum spaethianum TaxID=700344 RepID=A0AA37P9S6_9PEZI|nr:uncharacterized protein ColSpa_08440 [Colletotrichum spaethianum]GKT48259.1 hypothetical protein ColSpa_08440 [Colletotrichum spaethianum]
MQYSFILFFVFSYLPSFGLALPAASPAKGVGHHRFLVRGVRHLGTRTPQNDVAEGQTGASQGQNNTVEGRNGVSSTQIMNAVMSWMQDTGKVTKFLNTATSFTGAEFTKQATIALNAEIDELNHKMVLDTAFQGTDMVTQANAVLDTQGNFQAVVDTLQSMVTNGPDTAQKDVNTINNNRCVNVLPNIDMYFAAAGAPEVQAVRPTGCLEVEGANVTPAVPPPVKGGTAPPQVTQAPTVGNGNDNGNGNGQTQSGNGQNSNQNQADNSNGLNIGKGVSGNGGSTQSNNQINDQGNNNGQNIGKGASGDSGKNTLQPAKLGSQNSNTNVNNGNGNNQGQKQSQQQSQKPPSQAGSALQPARLGSSTSGSDSFHQDKSSSRTASEDPATAIPSHGLGEDVARSRGLRRKLNGVAESLKQHA